MSPLLLLLSFRSSSSSSRGHSTVAFVHLCVDVEQGAVVRLISANTYSLLRHTSPPFRSPATPPRVGPLSLLPLRGNLTSMPSPLPRTLDLSVTNAYPPPSGIGNHFHEFIPDAGFEKPMSRGLLLAHLRDRVFVRLSIPPSLPCVWESMGSR
ncbi:hypothetical protein ALC60_10123 [Trachymyrmex zeteki]|uniref:Uncharacterized protein n=1 Tax=Mycetomoellerius zeteki TaxID=64791 RepID=A0A151WSB6_9HYME|nr:hypothetical protein ALC60_10123 [Trachymyrmex zeteki]